MNNIILDKMKLNFKDIEKENFDVVCEAGLSRMGVENCLKRALYYTKGF